MSANESKNPVLFFLQESWLLMVAAIIFGCLLASLDAAWKDRIAQNEVDKFNALAMGLLTEATDFKEAIPIDLSKGKTCIVKVKEGIDADRKTVGWAFVCEGAGFADKIKLVVAVDAAFETVAGFGVLSSNETPGFGDKINIKDGPFQSQFKAAPVAELELTKIGDPEKVDNQIVAITGATVTSEAVVNIFNTFLLPIKEALQEQNLLQ